MKTNGSMVLWKKNTFFLFHFIFAFFTIVGWQLSEVSAETEICVGSVNLPDEIDELEVNDDPIEKTITSETDDDWFQSYFANEEDDINPESNDTNGEDHGINIGVDEDFYIERDLSWEVYDRNGNCVARGKSGDRFGPSAGPYQNNSLPSDVYFIRIVWDPEDDIDFDDGDGDLIYTLTLNGTGVPKVVGFIIDAFSGKGIKDVKAKNNNTGISFLSLSSGWYGFQAEEGENNPLDYDRDEYKPSIINDFEINENDYFRQNAILCPNDVVLTATLSSGDAPLPVKFDLPDVINPEVSAVYDWDFGDGMSSDSPDTVSHTYSDAGMYKVNVTVSITLPTSVFVTKEIKCTVESSVEVIVKERGGPPSGPDRFEPNNTPDKANEIMVDSSSDGFRNFHDGFDVDWVKFFVPLNPDIPNQAYKILVQPAEELLPNWSVFESDGTTELNHTQGNTFHPPSPQAFYLVKLENSDTSKLGADTAYTIRIIRIKTAVLPIGAIQLLLLDRNDR